MIYEQAGIVYLNFTFPIVFVTKYRKKVFTDAILKDIEVIFNNVCKDFDTELVEMNGETDHVHLLLNYPPKVSISKLVNSLKGVSSRLIRKQHPELAQYYWKGGLWSPSYFAGNEWRCAIINN